MTDDLAEFLLARYAEIEAKARKALLEADGWPLWVVTATDIAVGVDYSPAQVLADRAAKRAIVELHATQVRPVLRIQGRIVMSDPECPTCADWDEADYDGPPHVRGPCRTLRLLAQEFVDHPDFDPSWTITP